MIRERLNELISGRMVTKRSAVAALMPLASTAGRFFRLRLNEQ
jgi:hypothetical protein